MSKKKSAAPAKTVASKKSKPDWTKTTPWAKQPATKPAAPAPQKD